MASLLAGLDEIIAKVHSFRELAESGMTATQKNNRVPSQQQLNKIDQINQIIRDFDPLTKLVINAFNLAELEKIRYQTHTRQGLNNLSDAVKKYQSLYKSSVESSVLALNDLDKIKSLYMSSLESSEIIYKLLNKVY
jgi:hypothetical protein